MSELGKLSLAYIGLLVLLAITVGSSLIPLAGFNLAINMTIAAAKALIIAIVFMRVLRGEPLVHLVVATVGAWLVILWGLTLIG
jgi:cytochrome c oxidase subunit 4